MKKEIQEELTEEELEFIRHKEGLWDTQEEELKKHINFFKIKAETDGKACYILSRYYLFGAEDYLQGLKYANQGVENGNDDCYGLVAKCYEKGFGVRQDVNKAVRIYKLLAEEGNVFGTYALADCYLFGKGVDCNKKRAFKMFEKLANEDYAKAKYKLGLLYENGIGTFKDYKKAIYWYQKAIDEDDFQKAYCNLGAMYLHGNGTQPDLKKALEYFSLGAENRDPRSLFMLAKCHFRGLGTKPNLNKAIKLLKKADLKGDKLAKEYLKDVVGYRQNELAERKSVRQFFENTLLQ